ncbi:MAG: hypothetical protein J6A77_00005 [Lachnospiraceae bacterium]|nr:hypothetical protein [Lachnospiraceae bacterium]
MESVEIIYSTIDALGAIATVLSVIWAIKVYKYANEEKGYLETKDNIMKIPQLCRELNLLLTEPFFAAIGNSIANELKELFTENQTIEEYSEFLISEKSKNYKALAIYSGLKKCTEVSQINEIIRKLEESNRNILMRFPIIGKSIQKLIFYITSPAEQAISSHSLNKSLFYTMDDGETNELLKEVLKDAAATGSKELYFKELAIYLTNVSRAHMSNQHLGQRTIDLSYNMLSIVCKTFSSLDDTVIKSMVKKDRKAVKKFKGFDGQHAVEDAMSVYKLYQKLFPEHEWEKLIEYKGRIIELMENDD